MNKEVLCNIASAVENGWPLREVCEQAYTQKGKITDEKLLLKNGFSLDNRSIAVGLMSNFIPNFVCLDFDFEDKDLKTQIIDRIKESYKLEELFIRIGNRARLGQLWFICEDEVKGGNYSKLDIITRSKRCNAVGYHKDSGLTYHWPHKSPVTHTPQDLPIIDKALVDEIIDMVQDHFGVEVKEGNLYNGSRHDGLFNLARDLSDKNMSPTDVYNTLIESDMYQGIEIDRPNACVGEVEGIVSAIFNNFIEEKKYKDLYIPPSTPQTDFTDKDFKYPKADRGSILDILYKACKRNQYKDAEQIALFSAVSCCAWLLSFSTRFDGTAPNLIINYVAKSGAGKSDSSRLIKAVAALDSNLRKSIQTSVNSLAQISKSLETSPNLFLYINEYASLLKKGKNTTSHIVGLEDKIMLLYSDFGENDLHVEKIKDNAYGHCFGPKLNGLFFMTQASFSELDPSHFDAGLGRRMITIVDDTTYFVKPKKNKEIKKDASYFNDYEIKKIKEFINAYVYDNSEENADEMNTLYEQVDISHENLINRVVNVKGKPSEVVYHTTALKPKILNYMDADEETTDYLFGEHIEKANRMIEEAAKSGSEKESVIVNSFSEFTKKFLMIGALCADKTPSTVATMKAVRWAEGMVRGYMINDMKVNLNAIYSDEDKKTSYIKKQSEQFYTKLTSSETQTFTLSSNIARSFFRSERARKRSDILNDLIKHNKIKSTTKGVSKNATAYKVL